MGVSGKKGWICRGKGGVEGGQGLPLAMLSACSDYTNSFVSPSCNMSAVQNSLSANRFLYFFKYVLLLY